MFWVPKRRQLFRPFQAGVLRGDGDLLQAHQEQEPDRPLLGDGDDEPGRSALTGGASAWRG